jgi:hypothetical protein
VRAVGTACGFVAVHQQQTATGVDALVATSALMQIPLVLRMLRPIDKASSSDR